MFTNDSQRPTDQPATPFMGLAPFLRMSIDGTPLLPVGQEMLARAAQRPDDANLWMNLSIVMLCLGQREIGLSIQAQALALRRVYHLPAVRQPACCRVLMLMAPGDVAANTPLECLLENGDIDLCLYYVSPGNPLDQPVPAHDVLIVAMSEDDAHRDYLRSLERALAAWPTPVINRPQHIPKVERQTASELLQGIPGLLMPPTRPVSRTALQDVAAGITVLAGHLADGDFPVIARPVGSHAGRDLERLAGPNDLAAYLARVDGELFFISPFVDYSAQDGLFRKFRIALIDGVPYACHMAVSSHWMIHYVNAGMYDDAGKRQEEAEFMRHFGGFVQRHGAALAEVWRRSGLDYFCIDCAETIDGQLLIFEIDHAMVVHAMDPVPLFPYKQEFMQKVQSAFRDYLVRLRAAPLPVAVD